VNKNIDVQSKILDPMIEEIPNLTAKELPGAAKNVAIQGAIDLDSVRKLRGEPSTVVEDRTLRSVDEIDTTRVVGVGSSKEMPRK
jgi:hypothetical protein